eukprot:jgi/Chlat1/7756/Chrsp66S07223
MSAATIAAKAGSQAIFDSDDIPLDLLSFSGTGFGEAIGGRKANLSNQLQPWAEGGIGRAGPRTVSRGRDGCCTPCADDTRRVDPVDPCCVCPHMCRMIREVLDGRLVPIPVTDNNFGFTKFFDAAVGKVSSPRFVCYKDDIRFLLCTWLIDEIGATGDKGCILLMSNPGLADAVSGLAGSASYQSAVDRQLLWERRNYTIEAYGLRVFPTLKINNVPTDIRGLTLSRTPKQANGFAGYPGNRVTVRTLSQAGKANLLNVNIILPVPASEAVQLEASGAEYGPGFNITNLCTGLPIGPYADIFVPSSSPGENEDQANCGLSHWTTHSRLSGCVV